MHGSVGELQARPANNPGLDEIEAFDELPEGDETVTRRYEFYVYNGPTNDEDGEAGCDNPDDCEGAVGQYIGAQMAGFNVESALGLIDHIQDCDVSVAFVDRSVVIGGNTPYVVTISAGALPDGLTLDPTTGILSGTPTKAGVFPFTVDARDADDVPVSKAYTVNILAAPAPPPAPGDIDGDGDVDRNDLAVVVAGRNKPASGPDDPRDLDLDGTITVRDARILVTLFTRPGGAVL